MAENYKAKTDELYQVLAHVTDEDTKINLRNQVVLLNIRLVSLILKKYKPYTADNFQNGCLGLIQAAETYQKGTGVPFSSYACFCIERAIQLAYKKQQRTIEGSIHEDSWIRLDAMANMDGDERVDNNELIWDEKAQQELDQFIIENELTYLCDNIIKPSIAEVSDRGKYMKVKTDRALWEQLEFAYIMDLVLAEASQKKRFNLSQLARKADLSVTNVRGKHERVMELIFIRMWDYMALSFTEMLERLRGTKKIPSRLLCLDPGKTTGWCLFEDGKLTVVDHVEDCYDDKEIDAAKLIALIDDIQPDFIVYEDYKVYSHKLNQHTYSPVFTLRLIGAIEAYAQIKGIRKHKQMASTAKGFVTDEKLKQWGFWAEGFRHGRDAIRHGCYFLLFFKKGENI